MGIELVIVGTMFVVIILLAALILTLVKAKIKDRENLKSEVLLHAAYLRKKELTGEIEDLHRRLDRSHSRLPIFYKEKRRKIS